jgi:hypothetical protein
MMQGREKGLWKKYSTGATVIVHFIPPLYKQIMKTVLSKGFLIFWRLQAG